jgi:hypothetical protein
VKTKEKNIAKIAASIISTMSDQGSVNPVFDDKFKAFREDLLPLFQVGINLPFRKNMNLVNSFYSFVKCTFFLNMATETYTV